MDPINYDFIRKLGTLKKNDKHYIIVIISKHIYYIIYNIPSLILKPLHKPNQKENVI